MKKLVLLLLVLGVVGVYAINTTYRVAEKPNSDQVNVMLESELRLLKSEIQLDDFDKSLVESMFNSLKDLPAKDLQKISIGIDVFKGYLKSPEYKELKVILNKHADIKLKDAIGLLDKSMEAYEFDKKLDARLKEYEKRRS